MSVLAQSTVSRIERAEPGTVAAARLPAPPDDITDPSEKEVRERRLIFNAPYAGKLEARVGGVVESGHDRMRMDIGVASDLFNSYYFTGRFNQQVIAFGTEFATWSRLRDTGRWSFPVEAVDCYFGVHGSVNDFRRSGIDARIRLGHVSAFQPGVGASGTDSAPMTYSRELLDLMIAGNGDTIGGRLSGEQRWTQSSLYLRPYLGATVLLRVIPDTLGRLSPYAGFDLSWQAFPKGAIRAGYELLVDMELETKIEHRLRIGMMLGARHGAGVLLEAGYHKGRSPFGQRYTELEEVTSLGIGFDF